jgi:hypothetical protein
MKRKERKIKEVDVQRYERAQRERERERERERWERSD